MNFKKSIMCIAGMFIAMWANGAPILPDKPVDAASVKKIHLIFKTHLDVGFTNSGKNVINTYMTDFIPHTLDLIESLKESGAEKHYTWTTGSWIITKFLETASDEDVRRMEKAIADGDINWHALPFTTHTEMADASLYELGIQYCKDLDKRFGKSSISAKMTDVPGHTRSLIPVLARNGVKFLHIGVNSASTSPDVPSLFKWCAPDGSSVIVMYQQGYGDQLLLPGTGVMVDIRFTNDNHGPHTLEQIRGIYEELRSKYPNAEIVNSSLDDIALDVLEIEDRLPVITRELGDTWIHGIGSNPKMVAQFRELSRLRNKWISEGRFAAGDKTDKAFGLPLLMATEHTWGRDVKMFLKDWDIYMPEAFEAARSKASFRLMEESWNEKQNNIFEAIDNLPQREKEEALAAIDALEPKAPELKGFKKPGNISNTFKTRYFEVKFDAGNGSVISLKDRETGRQWADPGHPLFAYSYQTFNNADYERFLGQYLIRKVDWAFKDFGKPGLENCNVESAIRTPEFIEAYSKKDSGGQTFVLKLRVADGQGNAIGGSPADIYLELSFPDSEKVINATLKCMDKRAYRLPEAQWFSFIPQLGNGAEWVVDKMDAPVNFRDIESHGNRKMHGVTDGIALYEGSGKAMTITSMDCPLVMFGSSSLLDFNNILPAAEDGARFCLHNNVWGTNFSMWFDKDMLYRFTVRF